MKTTFKSYIHFIKNDKVFIKRVIILVSALVLLVFLRAINSWQKGALERLREQEKLVLSIPGMEKRLMNPASANGLTLSGILWNDESPRAIINDKFVNTGDMIAANKVVFIGKKSVTINDGAKDFELVLE